MIADLSDEELAGLAASGHERAFDQLYARHKQRVFARLTRVLGPGADCDDVMQQAFLGLHKALPRFRFQSKFSTFFYGIVNHKVRDQLRSRRRRVSEVEIDEAALAELAATVADPAERVFAAARLEKTFPLLDLLKPKHRLAFCLVRIEGLSYKDAAAELDISEHALRQRVSQATQKLSALLERRDRAHSPMLLRHA
jgi:RNA polymerase sigma-70 factor (ECF subfamily)